IGAAYTPMVRLALARYQPHSLQDAELSRIVLADVMSIEPGRAVTVTRSGKILNVTLSGYSYSKSSNLTGSGPGPAEVVLERHDPKVKDLTLGWSQVGEPHPMSASTRRGGLTTWTARLSAPSGHAKFRLSVHQYEIVGTDRRSTIGL